MSEYSQHILQQVASFIEQEHLFEGVTHTLFVGLSGGPDSVALLHILHQLSSDGFQSLTTHPRLTALHCNFHLRGEESDRDQIFCEGLCAKLGIELRVKEFDTIGFMRKHHLSLEMAARKLRYDWWQSVLSDHSPTSKIALGHHQDDSIENLLMNLMRGTGIQGLTGIVPRNECTQVIRPLLCLSRKEIIDYLTDNRLSYMQDSTNAECDTLRNQIRNQLLPLMSQLLPQARQGIVRTMSHLQESADIEIEYIKKYVAEHAVTHSIDGYTYIHVPASSTHRFQLQQYFLSQGFTFDGQVAIPLGKALPERPMPDPNRYETFDAGCIHFPLRWRRWKQGDRMAPLGMGGHTKLLSDLFSNAHYLPIEKQLAWVLEDAEGEILWVPGLRMSHNVRLTSYTHDRITISYGQVCSLPDSKPVSSAIGG